MSVAGSIEDGDLQKARTLCPGKTLPALDPDPKGSWVRSLSTGSGPPKPSPQGIRVLGEQLPGGRHGPPYPRTRPG